MTNPDLYDSDGDRWTWTESDDNGDSGYVWVRPHGHGTGGTAITRQQIEEAHGPITEVPSNQAVITLPEIPGHVAALASAVDPEVVYHRDVQNTWCWLDEQDNTYNLGEILMLHPEGVVPSAALSKYDEGLAYFRAHGVQRIYDTATAERHAVNVIKHILNH